jgi:hypothetical protein
MKTYVSGQDDAYGALQAELEKIPAREPDEARRSQGAG